MDTERIGSLTTPARTKGANSLISLPPPPADYIRTYVDSNLGDKFSDISINEALILARMREEGLSQDDIASLSLHVSGDTPVYNDEYTYGMYNRSSKSEITLYPSSEIASWHQQASKIMLDPARTATTCSVPNAPEKITTYVSETLFHEIRHARQDLAEGLLEGINIAHEKRLRAYRCIGSSAGLLVSTLGAFELATLGSISSGFAAPALLAGVITTAHTAEWYREATAHRDYYTNLAEIDARSAESDMSEPMITLSPKESVVNWTIDDFSTAPPSPKFSLGRRARMLAHRTIRAIEDIFE